MELHWKNQIMGCGWWSGIYNTHQHRSEPTIMNSKISRLIKDWICNKFCSMDQSSIWANKQELSTPAKKRGLTAYNVSLNVLVMGIDYTQSAPSPFMVLQRPLKSCWLKTKQVKALPILKGRFATKIYLSSKPSTGRVECTECLFDNFISYQLAFQLGKEEGWRRVLEP